MSALLITPLPPPPTRADPTNFNDRADAFLAAIEDPFVEEVNAISVDLTAKHSEVLSARTTAVNAASAAEASATTAASTANAAMWNAATNYAVGVSAISPTNFRTYRRKIAGISATDPAADATRWTPITVDSYSKTEADAKLQVSTWQIIEVGGALVFRKNNVAVAKLDASGKFTSVDNIEAFGSV